MGGNIGRRHGRQDMCEGKYEKVGVQSKENYIIEIREIKTSGCTVRYWLRGVIFVSRGKSCHFLIECFWIGRNGDLLGRAAVVLPVCSMHN
jgi:hypothetical protein